jgi:hypothetical protein
MKIRQGFVSNSSSASFVASLDKLTPKELNSLIQWCKDPDADHDSWTIQIDRETGLVEGWSSMDNGDLEMFLEQLGINKVKITGE